VTLKQTRNLGARQIAKVTPKSVGLILAQKKPNLVLLRKILFESKDREVLRLTINHFLALADLGNVKAKLFLNRLASEKYNKNEYIRTRVLENYWYVAKFRKNPVGLRALLVGVRDSNISNRVHSLMGLSELALHGDARTLPGLIEGLKDSHPDNHDHALKGIQDLAKTGNNKAYKILKELKK
jgi:hypothetical protein